MGIKTFTNNTGDTLQVYLFVRAGSTPGCIRRRVGFTLIANESKTVSYGSDTDPFLDGILAYQNSGGQYICTKMCVTVRGSAADNLLNTNNTILLGLTNSSIVITAANV